VFSSELDYPRGQVSKELQEGIEELMNQALQFVVAAFNRNRTLFLSVVFVVLIGAVIVVWTVGAARAASTAAAAVEEIVPAPDQQKPIKDLLAEQAQSNQGYQNKIDGAIRTLMALTKNPVTGEMGLKPTEWQATSDGKDGLKFVAVKKQPNISTGAATQPGTQPDK